MVARRPWLHKIIRDYTDPVLFLGTFAAVLHYRLQLTRAIRAGVIAAPEDPLADLKAAKQRVDDNVARAAAAAAPPPQAAAPQNETIVPPQPAAAAAPAAGVPASGLQKHTPHVDGELQGALAQMQAA